jgi:hypothetical protein
VRGRRTHTHTRCTLTRLVPFGGVRSKRGGGFTTIVKKKKKKAVALRDILLCPVVGSDRPTGMDRPRERGQLEVRGSDSIASERMYDRPSSLLAVLRHVGGAVVADGAKAKKKYMVQKG